jgi:hypothetical protein
MSFMLGEEYINDCQIVRDTKIDTQPDIFDTVTKKELRRIWADIEATTRPSWHSELPTNLGEPEHGKLKADQWRSGIEFDLPVSLAQLWSSEYLDIDPQRRDRQKKMLESTMFLAMAVRWGASYRTSQEHADKYMKYMHAYLKSILDLYPGYKLKPNHHAALHIGALLMRYGPVHGWWMFPFEQLIGSLQRIKTNHQSGKQGDR